MLRFTEKSANTYGNAVNKDREQHLLLEVSVLVTVLKFIYSVVISNFSVLACLSARSKIIINFFLNQSVFLAFNIILKADCMLQENKPHQFSLSFVPQLKDLFVKYVCNYRGVHVGVCGWQSLCVGQY